MAVIERMKVVKFRRPLVADKDRQKPSRGFWDGRSISWKQREQTAPCKHSSQKESISIPSQKWINSSVYFEKASEKKILQAHAFGCKRERGLGLSIVREEVMGKKDKKENCEGVLEVRRRWEREDRTNIQSCGYLATIKCSLDWKTAKMTRDFVTARK